MKSFLRGIPESFGKSFLVSGCLIVAYLLFLNSCIYLLMYNPKSWEYNLGILVIGIKHLKSKLDFGFEPALLVGFIVLSLIVYNLRLLSIKFLSGNLPFIWSLGRRRQIRKKNHINRKIFDSLSPLGWVAFGKMEWKLPEEIVAVHTIPFRWMWKKSQEIIKRQLTWPLLKCVRITTSCIKKWDIKPTPNQLKVPLWCMWKVLHSTKVKDGDYKEKKQVYEEFKGIIDQKYPDYHPFEDELKKLQKVREARYSSDYYDFPIDAAYIMPTLFGNILRRAESHANECYGIDPEVVWPHLIEVASKDYVKLMEFLSISV